MIESIHRSRLTPNPDYRCARCMGNARPIDGRPQNEVQVRPDKLAAVVASFCYLGDMLSAGGACRDFFLVSSGAEIRPLSQLDLGDFFPNLKKKISQSQKKKKFFFFLEFSHTHTHTHTYTHKLHNDNLLESHPIFLQFNGNSMCNS